MKLLKTYFIFLYIFAFLLTSCTPPDSPKLPNLQPPVITPSSKIPSTLSTPPRPSNLETSLDLKNFLNAPYKALSDVENNYYKADVEAIRYGKNNIDLLEELLRREYLNSLLDTEFKLSHIANTKKPTDLTGFFDKPTFSYPGLREKHNYYIENFDNTPYSQEEFINLLLISALFLDEAQRKLSIDLEDAVKVYDEMNESVTELKTAQGAGFYRINKTFNQIIRKTSYKAEDIEMAQKKMEELVEKFQHYEKKLGRAFYGISQILSSESTMMLLTVPVTETQLNRNNSSRYTYHPTIPLVLSDQKKESTKSLGELLVRYFKSLKDNETPMEELLPQVQKQFRSVIQSLAQQSQKELRFRILNYKAVPLKTLFKFDKVSEKTFEKLALHDLALAQTLEITYLDWREKFGLEPSENWFKGILKQNFNSKTAAWTLGTLALHYISWPASLTALTVGSVKTVTSDLNDRELMTKGAFWGVSSYELSRQAQAVSPVKFVVSSLAIETVWMMLGRKANGAGNNIRKLSSNISQRTQSLNQKIQSLLTQYNRTAGKKQKESLGKQITKLMKASWRSQRSFLRNAKKDGVVKTLRQLRGTGLSLKSHSNLTTPFKGTNLNALRRSQNKISNMLSNGFQKYKWPFALAATNMSASTSTLVYGEMKFRNKSITDLFSDSNFWFNLSTVIVCDGLLGFYSAQGKYINAMWTVASASALSSLIAHKLEARDHIDWDRILFDFSYVGLFSLAKSRLLFVPMGEIFQNAFKASRVYKALPQKLASFSNWLVMLGTLIVNNGVGNIAYSGSTTRALEEKFLIEAIDELLDNSIDWYNLPTPNPEDLFKVLDSNKDMISPINI